MKDAELELKRRAGDQRQALIPLLEYTNTQVRLKAAFATLVVAPKAARRALQRISDENDYELRITVTV